MYLKRTVPIWIFIFLIQLLNAQNYAVSGIKKELLKDANAVIREQEHIFTVTDTGKAEYTQHIVITVLNKNGDKFASFYDYYDRFEKITDIKGKIYNSEGKVVRKLKASDFSDHSAISDFSLFEDNRVKYFVPAINIYPYTVEYENAGVMNGIISYPAWRPQHSFDLSVEHSSYKITVPKGFNLRFKKLNYTNEPQTSEFIDKKTLMFEISNLNAVEEENLSQGITDIVPTVYTIPDYFKIDNFSGSNKSWKSLGEWDQRLNFQENALSAKTKSDLAEIQAKANNRVELIKKVYEYMQSKTRYVSIQLGIGGLKPFDAAVVDKYGYGDCKALSNYMKSLLKEVGIESIYTLVHAGSGDHDIYFEESFLQFNHAIVCVPDKSDTIWLECTNQLIPFGFLGDFTDNRHVLMITNEGGKLVKTPKYSKEQNLQTRKAEIVLTPDGNGEGSVKTTYFGLQYDDNYRLINSPPDKQKELLYDHIDIPSFIINSFSFKEYKERIPWLDENITMTIRKCASVMGNRLFLPLNLMNKRSAISSVMKERKTRLRLRYSYIDADSINYRLPHGYTMEFIPPPTEIKSEFGTYYTRVVENPDKESFLYIRMMTINDGLYPPEKYKDYVSFMKEVNKQDNAKISLVTKKQE